MNIFHKRPLCLILCVMLGGFVFFERGNNAFRYALVICAAVLYATATVASFIFGRRYRLMKIVASLLILSALLSHIYFEKWYDFAKEYEGDVKIEGRVTEIDASSSRTTTLYIDTRSVAGKTNANSYRMILRISKGDAMYVYEGADVSFTADIESIESSDDFDAKSYYYSKGISATSDKYSDFKVLGQGRERLSDKLGTLKENVSRQSMLTMGAEAGALFSAVFMGERSYLSPRLSLDFQRIGISHILALSGMHLAILSLGLTKLLSLLGVSKKPRTVFIAVFVLFYMALTGFSVSVVRAGIMLVISSILYLFSSTKDLPTNLAISVSIICLITPYSVFDISLWLSAFATLGIIVMSEMLSDKFQTKNLILRFLSWIGASFAASFFAISATLAICTTFTESTSLLGAPATLIFSLLVEIFIYLGLIILALGFLFPIGAIVMTPLYTVIDKTASALSSPRWVVLSTDEKHIDVLISVFTVMFFAFIIIKIKHVKAACLVLVASFLFVHGAAAYETYSDIYRDDVIYASYKKHDIFTLKSDGKCAVIDVCSYTESSAYDTIEVLTKENISTLDMYVASHYSFGLDNAVGALLSKIKTARVLVPVPISDDERAIFSLVKTYTDKFNTELVTYSIGESVKVGEFTFTGEHRVIYGEDSMQNAFKIIVGNKTSVYLGSGMLNTDTREKSYELLALADTVIFGSHGKTYKEEIRISEVLDNVKRFIIRGDKISIDEGALGIYKRKSTEIITDPGTVSIMN